MKLTRKNKKQEATLAPVESAVEEQTSETASVTTEEPAAKEDDFEDVSPPEEEKPEVKCPFSTVVFLMSKAEARAVLWERPDVIPSNFEGERLVSEVRSGFDRNVCSGARVIGFAISCNLAALAHDAIEVPCKSTAYERRNKADLIRKEEDGERKKQLEAKLTADTAEAIRIQELIPLRRYTVHEEARDSSIVEELGEF